MFCRALVFVIAAAAFGQGRHPAPHPITGPGVGVDARRGDAGLFPSDLLTVPDAAEKTGRRVALPLPDCGTQPSTCAEIAALNHLDGFEINPRIAVHFSGAVKPETLSGGIVLVAIGNVTSDEPGMYHQGDVITVNQVEYDPSSNTAYAKPNTVLDQDRRFALVVTDAVLDAAGKPIHTSNVDCGRADAADYCQALMAARAMVASRIGSAHVAALSVFTTMSETFWMEQARSSLPSFPASVKRTGSNNVFTFANMTGFTWHQQTGSNPATFTDLALPFQLVQNVRSVAFASFESPNYLNAQQFIPDLPTSAVPVARPATSEIFFHAFLPASTKPANGYPVVIFGHGFGDSRFGGPSVVATQMAGAGFAVVAMDAVGHGYGPQSTVVIQMKDGSSTTVPAPGRGVDLDGNGTIDSTEGCVVAAPVAYAMRDCLRQTAVDLMQFVRAIRGGIDLDGDGAPDLDPNRVYYIGQSLGSIYGTIFMAVDPNVRDATLNAGGGSATDIARWSVTYRPLAAEFAALRTPSLLNAGTAFNDDAVLRDQPVKIITVPGAVALQDFFARLEWLQSSGDPLSYAPHLKPSPLAGVPVKTILWQFAKGDQSVPNPMESALVRAADMQGSTWMYLADVARTVVPGLPANPHAYLTELTLTALPITLAVHQQIAGFFVSDGSTIPDPNTAVRAVYGTNLFIIPAVLPEQLNF